MTTTNSEAKHFQPVGFDVWVRALANEIGPMRHHYTKDNPEAFQQAVEYLTSDEVLAPKGPGYPASCFLANGTFTDGYLGLLFIMAYRGHTVEDPLYGDELKHISETYPEDPNVSETERTGELASFAGILETRGAEGYEGYPRLVYYTYGVPVRDLAARDINDLRRIHQTIASCAQPKR